VKYFPVKANNLVLLMGFAMLSLHPASPASRTHSPFITWPTTRKYFRSFRSLTAWFRCLTFTNYRISSKGDGKPPWSNCHTSNACWSRSD